MSDLISRQAALDAIQARADMELADVNHYYLMGFQEAAEAVESVPDAQPEERTNERTETHACDLIDRQAAIDAIITQEAVYADDAIDVLRRLPSAQPQRTCVNCGRTANNGGWYADGRTRCPIEEHYALPKDGYCHLWEKRNVTDDDYPERR